MTPTRALSAHTLSCAAALALSLGGAVGAFVITAGPSAAAASFGPVDHTIPDGNTGWTVREILENEISDGDTVILQRARPTC